MNAAAIVPAFNEEKTIEEVVKQLKEIDIMPVVINDLSQDKTAKIAKKAGAKVINHKINKGKGEAIKTGFNYIENNCPEIEYIVIVDGDLQFSPRESIKLINALKRGEADYVIGRRYWDQVPFRHKLGNFVWRTTFNLFFRTGLKDVNCGFVAFRKDVGEKLEFRGGYIIDNSLEIQALKNGFKLKNIPVSVNYKEKREISHGIRMVLGVLIFIIKEGVKYL